MLALAGCNGGLSQPCFRDGTCEGALVCQKVGFGTTYECRKAEPQEGPRTPLEPESVRFCRECREHCNGSVWCAYSDTSVWGSKPSVCECRPVSP